MLFGIPDCGFDERMPPAIDVAEVSSSFKKVNRRVKVERIAAMFPLECTDLLRAVGGRFAFFFWDSHGKGLW